MGETRISRDGCHRRDTDKIDHADMLMRLFGLLRYGRIKMNSILKLVFIGIVFLSLVACNGEGVDTNTHIKMNPSSNEVELLNEVDGNAEEIHRIVSEALRNNPRTSGFAEHLSIGGLSIGIAPGFKDPDTDVCASCLICNESGSCRSTSMCCSSTVLNCNDPCSDGDYCPVGFTSC